MKQLLVLGLVSLALIACGDDGNEQNPPPECIATGTQCVADEDCCTGNCDDLTGQCSRVPGACLAADAECTSGPDCCSFSCVNFRCSGDQCTSDNEACEADGECCGGICLEGTCAPLNPACRTSGNTCASNTECCSGYCKEGVCNNAPSFCTQAGDTCTTDTECCGGLCSIVDGALLGTCLLVPSTGATSCATAGELCGVGADYNGGALPVCGGECCSRACFPYGPTGALVCQPPSGCKPTGEVCAEDSDCCGSAGSPDGDVSNVRCNKVGNNPTGRCDNGNSCSPAGAICKLQSDSCNANTNCCAGNSQVSDPPTCAQDNLGIPRCTATGTVCDDPQSTVGMTCATSADCCGLPCVPVSGEEFHNVCAGSCVQENGACTNSADCCAGLPCTLPPGSSSGTCGPNQGCANYGQTCDPSANNCCNNVSCTDPDADGTFTCGQIIL